MTAKLETTTFGKRSMTARFGGALGVALMLVVGTTACGKSKAAAKAEQQKATEQEMDKRAGVAASAAVKQALDERDKEVADRLAKEADQRRADRDGVVKHPENFLASSNVQTSTKSGTVQITSVSVANNSKYPMTDVRGTMDVHGGPADGGTQTTDIIASVPVELSGAIAPGASMVFTLDAHTVTGGTVKAQGSIDHVSFTVTGVKSVGVNAWDDDTRVAMRNQDGGAPQ